LSRNFDKVKVWPYKIYHKKMDKSKLMNQKDKINSGNSGTANSGNIGNQNTPSSIEYEKDGWNFSHEREFVENLLCIKMFKLTQDF
jgi:hypothetical protein